MLLYVYAMNYFLIINFLFCFWLCWVFVAACWLSLIVASRGLSSWDVRASHCGVFSLQSTDSRACGLSSCGAWVSLLHSTHQESSWTRD